MDRNAGFDDQGRNPAMERAFVASVMLTAACAGLAAHAADGPQGYPSRPIRMIVPQAPGSASDTVARIIAAGTAASVTLPLGGKIDMPQINLLGKPLTVTGKVTRITDGEFVVTGPMATGTRVRMGRTAVLDTGSMQIVVSERRSEPSDLGVFTHCGIDPRRKKYVLIKSRQHFRAGFEPIARHIVLCDGDGVTSSDLRLFTYRNRRRPLYPFEQDL